MSNSPYIQTANEPFDAIVVGSGITGGWAAKELTEKGLKTLLVERGQAVEHRKDYVGEGVKAWDMPQRGRVDKKRVDEQHSIQQECYAFNDATKQFFGNDRDYPYQQEKPFSWIRGNAFGGKSLLWHRQSYRWSDLDFAANQKDGHGVDWPIRYKDVAPWYSYVEKHAGISGSRENLAVLPDSEFLPAFEFNQVEKDIKKRIEKRYQDRKMIIGRCAHLSEPAQHHVEQGRYKCMARNECQKGCSFGAYFSTQSSTLPAALKTGNLSIATDSVVHSVIYDDKTNRVTGVRVIDAETLETREYYAKVVFLCASTLGTTQIMLNSKSDAFPTGIANSSGALGHYLMDHLYGVGATADVEGFHDAYYKGRRPTGIYIPRFRNVEKQDANFLRGYSFAGNARRDSWQSLANGPLFGLDLKEKIRNAGDWHFRMNCSGEMLPHYDNHVRLHDKQTDKWGIPQLIMHCERRENEEKMIADIAKTSVEMLESIGLKNVKSFNNPYTPGLAIHEVGTARMGRDPKTSVLNGYNQSHDIPNLFVTDGASFASSAWQNPSLTFMALTARACDYAANALNRGEI
ncbi:GMC family oxidoreductase [Gilvimarinus sp. SDUM040013]|uniref:GMC family oxidoreductase n=1 Tax=Gilvimarinus gilvus TaxID=3058038 RepID=A0ABU4RWD9_9GAMM|nr:GMC family oxidoreductase [Gilvimarinus sp. SDUM040013]MDO3385213.1 GMC family oxidoreductase [Gilvimarinus sp. SDUM040013]MDX6849196.1 GMC family oxidoreductase [Gilvimarinus sp. SDUM040013]